MLRLRPSPIPGSFAPVDPAKQEDHKGNGRKGDPVGGKQRQQTIDQPADHRDGTVLFPGVFPARSGALYPRSILSGGSALPRRSILPRRQAAGGRTSVRIINILRQHVHGKDRGQDLQEIAAQIGGKGREQKKKNIIQGKLRAQVIPGDAAQNGDHGVMGKKGAGMLHRHEMPHEQVQIVMDGDVTVFSEKKKNRRLSQNGGSQQEPVPFFDHGLQQFFHFPSPSRFSFRASAPVSSGLSGAFSICRRTRSAMVT